jgi:hypothetical protein
MNFPKPPDVPFVQSVIFVMSKIGEHIGLTVFDTTMSREHPLYMLSIPKEEVERMLGLFGMVNGSALIFPGSCWADYLSFQESGEIPLGFDKENK